MWFTNCFHPLTSAVKRCVREESSNVFLKTHTHTYNALSSVCLSLLAHFMHQSVQLSGWFSISLAHADAPPPPLFFFFFFFFFNFTFPSPFRLRFAVRGQTAAATEEETSRANVAGRAPLAVLIGSCQTRNAPPRSFRTHLCSLFSNTRLKSSSRQRELPLYQKANKKK